MSLVVASMGIATVCAAVELVSAQYLRHYSARYRKQVKEIRQEEAAYRRPAVFGDPLEQNAAVWYRQAFRHFAGTTFEMTGPVVTGGFDHYGETVTPIVISRCGEAQGPRVRNALRSTHCDWEVGVEPDAFAYPYEAAMLTQCLIVQGHRAAYEQNRCVAARAYLESVAVGSDLTVADQMAGAVGMNAALLGLQSLAKLAIVTDDAKFLVKVAQDLAQFDGRLTRVDLALRRQRLWLENALSRNVLADSDERFWGFDRVLPWRTWSAWRLWRQSGLLEDFGRAATITERDTGLKLADRLKQGTSGSDLLKIADMSFGALVAVSALELEGFYRATQAAIRLQEWRIAHGTYPLDDTALSPSLASRGFRYVSLRAGAGYKLIGPRGTFVERQP